MKQIQHDLHGRILPFVNQVVGSYKYQQVVIDHFFELIYYFKFEGSSLFKFVRNEHNAKKLMVPTCFLKATDGKLGAGDFLYFRPYEWAPHPLRDSDFFDELSKLVSRPDINSAKLFQAEVRAILNDESEDAEKLISAIELDKGIWRVKDDEYISSRIVLGLEGYEQTFIIPYNIAVLKRELAIRRQDRVNNFWEGF